LEGDVVAVSLEEEDEDTFVVVVVVVAVGLVVLEGDVEEEDVTDGGLIIPSSRSLFSF